MYILHFSLQWTFSFLSVELLQAGGQEEIGSGSESTESGSSSFFGHCGLIWLLSSINSMRTQAGRSYYASNMRSQERGIPVWGVWPRSSAHRHARTPIQNDSLTYRSVCSFYIFWGGECEQNLHFKNTYLSPLGLWRYYSKGNF